MTKQNLLDLADRVEAGENVGNRLIHKSCGLPFYIGGVPASTAYEGTVEVFNYLGSLDAAKSLHDSALMGWTVGHISQDKADHWNRWDVRLAHRSGDNWCNSVAGRSTSLSAAWVAAILRAKAGEEGKDCKGCKYCGICHHHRLDCKDDNYSKREQI